MGRKLGKVINCQSPLTVMNFLQQDLTHDTSTTSLNNAMNQGLKHMSLWRTFLIHPYTEEDEDRLPDLACWYTRQTSDIKEGILTFSLLSHLDKLKLLPL